MAVQKATVIWTDFNGVNRQTTLTTVSGAAPIIAALQANSWAQVLQWWQSGVLGPTGLAAPHSYQSVRSAVSLNFQSSAGGLLRVTLPSPQLLGAVNPTGIFLADQRTVDSTQIPGIIAACIGNLSDDGSNTAVAYISGILQPGRNDLPATR